MTKSFFLVFGIPKTGTTFLQRMLNMHPAVSCPSEQSFAPLNAGLTAVLGQYQAALRVIDRRTGGQGIPTFNRALGDNALSALVISLARSFAGGKPTYGLNENSIIDNVAFFDRIFDRPRMIAIFRDPVDTAVSIWRHNHRLAKLEPANAAAHLALVRNPAGTLDGFVPRYAELYRTKAESYLAYAADKPNFLTTRYESLVAEKSTELGRVLRFLDVDGSDDVIEKIVAGSSREQMAKTSANPEFFSLGPAERDRYRVSDDVTAQAKDRLRPQLRRLGYDP